MAIACLLDFILSSALFAYPSYGLPRSARNDNKKLTHLVIARRQSRRGNRLHSWFCSEFSSIFYISHMDCRAPLAMTHLTTLSLQIAASRVSICFIIRHKQVLPHLIPRITRECIIGITYHHFRRLLFLHCQHHLVR